jgi:hypothetical protein
MTDALRNLASHPRVEHRLRTPARGSAWIDGETQLLDFSF